MGGSAGSLEAVNRAADWLAVQVAGEVSDAIRGWQLDDAKVAGRWQWRGMRPEVPDREWDSAAGSGVIALVDWYLSLARRRICIVGGPGAGKTSLAQLLVRQLVKRRENGDAVPVFLPITDWDVEQEHLDDWLERRLRVMYRGLQDRTFGRNAARDLIDAGRIVPVLDGFDELSAVRQVVTAEVLATATDDDALVLTSRPTEFAGAPAPLRASMSVSLFAEPITSTNIAAFIASLPHDLDAWQPVLDMLAAEPDGSLAATLSTPLDLWLLRSAFLHGGRADPAVLIEKSRSGNPAAVRDHLLDAFVPAALAALPTVARDRQRPRSPRRADKWGRAAADTWLPFLAQHLLDRTSSELAWWHLPVAAKRLTTKDDHRHAKLMLLVEGGRASIRPEPGTGPTPVTFQLRVKELTRDLWKATKSLVAITIGGVFGYGLSGADAATVRVFLLLTLFVILPTTFAFVAVRRSIAPTAVDEAGTPNQLLRADRAASIGVPLIGLLTATLGSAGTAVIGSGVGAAPFLIVPAMVFTFRNCAWPRYAVAKLRLVQRELLPRRLPEFLDDMCRAGILRRSGPYYQFRHVELRNRIALRGYLAHPRPVGIGLLCDLAELSADTTDPEDAFRLHHDVVTRLDEATANDDHPYLYGAFRERLVRWAGETGRAEIARDQADARLDEWR